MQSKQAVIYPHVFGGEIGIDTFQMLQNFTGLFHLTKYKKINAEQVSEVTKVTKTQGKFGFGQALNTQFSTFAVQAAAAA